MFFRSILVLAAISTVAASVSSAADAPDLQAPRTACSFCEQGLRMETDVTFSRTYGGSYRPGEPYDFVTVTPDGSGETFAETGIRIRVRFLCERTTPAQVIVGGSAVDFLLWSPELCMCTPKVADSGTDSDGWVEWSGSLAAGGCAQQLSVFIDGVFTGTVPIRINSPDLLGTSECHTDASDFAVMATHLGQPSRWDICLDFNESGSVIDASDLAYFASFLGSACP